MKLFPADRLSVTILFCLLTALFSGCYTLLKHPDVEHQPETTDFNRCSECHTDFHDTGLFDPVYSDPWWDYYALPWWYEDVIVITDEGEMPFGRIIHEKKLRYREEGGMGITPHVPRHPSEVDEKRERENLKEETGDGKRVKKAPARDKSIKKPEQLKKKKSEDRKNRDKEKTDRQRRESKDRDKE